VCERVREREGETNGRTEITMPTSYLTTACGPLAKGIMAKGKNSEATT